MKTTKELIDCAKRELTMRERVYGKKVLEGRMPKEKADHEIECMKQILKLVEATEQAELEL